jgi:NADPH-dependent glutamate synthase beta subunit-like oxidoreductase
MIKRVYEFMYDERIFHDIPCQANCPVHTDVEGYIGLIAEGDFEGAHRLIRETNPFPSVCGRVCQHYCERGCNRMMIDKSVAIMQLKRVATDYSKATFKFPEPTINTLERVAIIGAGPCGLTTAHDLAKLGYRVTVFEAMAHPGGMLRYGIPAYRLPREVIDYETEYIKRLGVEIRYNVRVGEDITLEELLDEFKAVFIAAGAHKAVKLNVPGESFKGVYGGSDFMRYVNMGESVPNLYDKTVCVIGGGFSAMDVSRTSIRLGAKKVYILYRRTRDEIPVNEKEIIEAEEEEIEFKYLVSPVELVSNDGENLSGIKVVENRLGEPDSSGRRRPEPIPGSEFVIDCDFVMPAVSQTPDNSLLEGGKLEFNMTKWGTLEVDRETLKTNIPRVFAAGDFITGTRDAIIVIAEGHRASVAIDSFIRGDKAEFKRKDEIKEVSQTMTKQSMYDAIPRVYPETIPMGTRLSTFKEVERVFSLREAMDEADRCLRCNHSWRYDSDVCILCMNCVDVCPRKCLSMDRLSELQFNRLYNEEISLKQQGIEGIVIDRDLCIRCNFCGQVCPTDAISFAVCTSQIEKAGKTG